MHSLDDLQASWKALRGNGEVRVREIACVGAPRTILCAEMGSHTAPEIALAAGVHGDEPAGPGALLALVREGELDPSFAYRMWPCTNPSGYSAGARTSIDGNDINRSFGRGGQTPEARAIITANRDRKFELSLDLHEDYEAEGFYCYEYGLGGVGRAVVEAVRERGYPIQDISRCDLGAPFEEPELEDGVVRPTRTLEDGIGGLSYTMSIVRRAAKRALTFETPTRLPFEERIAIHRIAVKAAIGALSKP